MSTKRSGNRAKVVTLELLLWGRPSALPLKLSIFGVAASLIVTLLSRV